MAFRPWHISKTQLAAILLGGSVLVVVVPLTTDFAKTGGPRVRAHGKLTSLRRRMASTPSNSTVSSTGRSVETGKSLNEVPTKAPTSAVPAGSSVMTLPFLAMTRLQVRAQTEGVVEADSWKTVGEAESADEGHRGEVYEELERHRKKVGGPRFSF